MAMEKTMDNTNSNSNKRKMVPQQTVGNSMTVTSNLQAMLNGCNPLDAIASVSLLCQQKQIQEKQIEDDKTSKIKKRRSQIAAASRKSRAKRKQELTTLKAENDRLWTEVVELKKKLKDINGGADVSNTNEEQVPNDSSNAVLTEVVEKVIKKQKLSDDEHDSVTGNENDTRPSSPSSTFSPASPSSSQSNSNSTPHLKQETLNIPSRMCMEMNSLQDSSTAVSSAIAVDPMLQGMTNFFNSRLNWYFTQLKSDCISHFGQSLSFELKQKVANLEVKICSASNADA